MSLSINYVSRVQPHFTKCQELMHATLLGFAVTLILAGAVALAAATGLRLGSYAHTVKSLGTFFLAAGGTLGLIELTLTAKTKFIPFYEAVYSKTSLITPVVREFLCGPRFMHGESDTRNPLWDTWENIVLIPLGGFRRYIPSPEQMEELYHPAPVTPMHDQIRIRWMGHASFLIETENTTILTDPNLSESIPFIGPIPLYYRSVPPGLEFNQIPPIKNVLLSHTHRDHFDPPTHDQFIARDDPHFFCPVNAPRLIQSKNVTQMTWWQTLPLQGGVTITYVPSNHASQTTATDCNEYLWGGYMISIPLKGRDPYVIYFMGDTACNINPDIEGYQPELSEFDETVFTQIHEQFPKIDLVCLQTDPISGQEDKHFNLDQGRDLLKNHLKIDGKIIPMHWGTWPFNQFGNDLMAPFRHLAENYKQNDPELFQKLHRLRVGECITLA